MPDLIVDYDMVRKTFAIVQQEDVTNISMNVVDNNSPFSAPDTVKSLEFSYKKEKGAKDNGFHRWKCFSQKYTCEEKEVFSHDGVKVPLTILFSRTAFQKGQSPGLLHGYGAYGEGLDKSWCPDRLSLIDQGWMFAFADVRYWKPSHHFLILSFLQILMNDLVVEIFYALVHIFILF